MFAILSLTEPIIRLPSIFCQLYIYKTAKQIGQTKLPENFTKYAGTCYNDIITPLLSGFLRCIQRQSSAYFSCRLERISPNIKVIKEKQFEDGPTFHSSSYKNRSVTSPSYCIGSQAACYRAKTDFNRLPLFYSLLCFFEAERIVRDSPSLTLGVMIACLFKSCGHASSKIPEGLLPSVSCLKPVLLKILHCSCIRCIFLALCRIRKKGLLNVSIGLKII